MIFLCPLPNIAMKSRNTCHTKYPTKKKTKFSTVHLEIIALNRPSSPYGVLLLSVPISSGHPKA